MSEKPKRKNSDAKPKLSCLVLVGTSVVCMFIFTYSLPYLFKWLLPPPKLADECELQVNDNLHLRIEVYLALLQGDPRLYQSSTDSGETWNMIYTYTNSDDSNLVPDCSAFEIISSDSIFVVPVTQSIHHFFITHDGGETWHEWRPDILDYPDDVSSCSSINEVSFQNENHGEMEVGCTKFDGGSYVSSPTKNLYTIDGGITWNIADD